MPRKIVVLAALMLAIMSSLGFVGNSAMAAPHVQHHTAVSSMALSSCWGSGCYNLDPKDTGCTGNVSTDDTGTHYTNYHGVIVDREGTQLAEFWNLYSYSCNANWVFGRLLGGTRLKLTISAQGENLICDPDGCSSFFTFASAAWSNMVDGTNVTQACAYTTSNEPGDHQDYSLCVNR